MNCTNTRNTRGNFHDGVFLESLLTETLHQQDFDKEGIRLETLN